MYSCTCSSLLSTPGTHNLIYPYKQDLTTLDYLDKNSGNIEGEIHLMKKYCYICSGVHGHSSNAN